VGKVETGSRVRGRIERVLAYSKVRGWRSSTENPVSGATISTLPARSKVAPTAIIALSIGAPFLISSPTSQRSVSHHRAPACRSGEARGACRDEIDFNGRLRTIPALRMKAKRPHRVPFTDSAIEVLGSAWERYDDRGGPSSDTT
jgi:integrase